MQKEVIGRVLEGHEQAHRLESFIQDLSGDLSELERRLEIACIPPAPATCGETSAADVPSSQLGRDLHGLGCMVSSIDGRVRDLLNRLQI